MEEMGEKRVKKGGTMPYITNLVPGAAAKFASFAFETDVKSMENIQNTHHNKFTNQQRGKMKENLRHP